MEKMSLNSFVKTKYSNLVRNRQLNRLEVLLRKLDIDVSLAEDENREKRYKQEVYTIIDSIIPKCLYKYRQCSTHAFDSLVNDELLLNTVSNFNDPTESMAYINPDELVNLASSIDNNNSIFENDSSNDLNHLTKRVDLLNDGLEYVNYLRDKLKIVCLSEVYDSTLMWSHYADCHKGFAVRYRVDDFNMSECRKCKKRDICWRPDKMLYPVIYKDKRFNATLIAFSKTIFLRTDMLEESGWTEEEIPIPILTVLQKELAWKYEKEWRIICKDINTNFIHIKPDALFMGESISCENAIKLSQIAEQKNIPLFKMSIDYFSPRFNLGCEDWSDYTIKDIKELLI